jgi:hypothetical protein
MKHSFQRERHVSSPPTHPFALAKRANSAFGEFVVLTTWLLPLDQACIRVNCASDAIFFTSDGSLSKAQLVDVAVGIGAGRVGDRGWKR